MRRTAGRKGQPTEYIQYEIDKPRKLNIVTQASGAVWNVFIVEPGKKGAVLTVSTHIKTDGFEPKEKAEIAAESIALAFEKYFKTP